jgi:NAD(P)-dependent dehydrogenase (short-subunit alcohol dehydrogenase family)
MVCLLLVPQILVLVFPDTRYGIGAGRTERDAHDPLASLSLGEVQREFAVNTFSTLFAAKAAVEGFKQLPDSASRTFIFTGNKLNTLVWPHVMVFGMGKTATAKMIQDASVAYRPQGFR